MHPLDRYDSTSTATAGGVLGGGASTTALVGSKGKNDVIALRFSPDGHVLAAATRDKQVGPMVSLLHTALAYKYD